jgi:hypothetical protein
LGFGFGVGRCSGLKAATGAGAAGNGSKRFYSGSRFRACQFLMTFPMCGGWLTKTG